MSMKENVHALTSCQVIAGIETQIAIASFTQA